VCVCVCWGGGVLVFGFGLGHQTQRMSCLSFAWHWHGTRAQVLLSGHSGIVAFGFFILSKFLALIGVNN
jgi:hypothetical protein